MWENQDPSKLFRAQRRVNSSPSCAMNSTLGLLSLQNILMFKTSKCKNTKILELAQTSVAQPLLYLKITGKHLRNTKDTDLVGLGWSPDMGAFQKRPGFNALPPRVPTSVPDIKRCIQCCRIPSCCWMRGCADFHASDSNGRQRSRVWFWNMSTLRRHLDRIRWVLRYNISLQSVSYKHIWKQISSS